MIVVHMSEKYCIQLLGPDAKPRQAHCGAATCVELELDSSALIGVIAIAH
jgi:hypothetical protein